METLTQKSHRIGNANSAIAMCKGAIITACSENDWKKGIFRSIKYPSSDVDIDFERLEESRFTIEAEKAIFRTTRARIRDVRAYLEGRPTELSSVDDLGWVKTLKSVFVSQTKQDKGAGEASIGEQGGPSTKPVSSNKDANDGFKTQKVYGGSGGPPKD